MIGIYRILNKINGKYYIGGSIRVSKRINNYRYELNKGIHENPRLQEDWNKYGKDAFEFELLQPLNDDQKDCVFLWIS
jgi:group I intron endonuclease